MLPLVFMNNALRRMLVLFVETQYGWWEMQASPTPLWGTKMQRLSEVL
jgi:hypothetical protein